MKKTLLERFREKFMFDDMRIDCYSEEVEQFFASELEDIIKEIEDNKCNNLTGIKHIDLSNAVINAGLSVAQKIIKSRIK